MINCKDWLKNQPKIVQIMPATEWFAVFVGQDEQPASAVRVLCWVLAEDHSGFRSVEAINGFDLEQRFLSNDARFDGYAHKDELAERLAYLNGL